MVENQDIVQGAITKTKLSKNLRLDLTNLPQGTVGQIPVIQSDGNWGLVELSGDISITADGTTTVLNNAEITAADIDTAFNFIHDENGYIVRSPQREGQTTVYEVDNSTYVTEVVAAAHADHAVSTGGSKKFTLEFVWGTDQTGLVVFSSDDDDDSIGTFTHGLKNKNFVISIRAVNAESGSNNVGYAADELTDVGYDPFRIIANTINTLQLLAQDVSSSAPKGTWAITIVG